MTSCPIVGKLGRTVNRCLSRDVIVTSTVGLGTVEGTVEKFELLLWRECRSFRLYTRLWRWNWWGVRRTSKDSTLRDQEEERKKKEQRRKVLSSRIHGVVDFSCVVDNCSGTTGQRARDMASYSLAFSSFVFSSASCS